MLLATVSGLAPGNSLAPNHGVIHGGEIVHRKNSIAEHAKDNHGNGQDRRHDGPPDEWFREVHDCPAAFAAGALPPPAFPLVDTHLAPGSHGDRPLMTTRSPGLSPCSTTTKSPWRCPIFTGLDSAVESSFTTYTNGPFAESCGVRRARAQLPASMARISLTFTKRPGHSRWLPLGIVARSKTVPLLLCTALSRNVSCPANGLSNSSGRRTSTL